jgi:hypothetical protein
MRARALDNVRKRWRKRTPRSLCEKPVEKR